MRRTTTSLRAAADALRSNFFFLPAVAVVLAFVAARFAVGVDTGPWVGESTVASARAVLSTVAAATITFASISFSVSLLIMQQGSSQFSPRVIHGLTRDPFHRRVIAIVLATFTFCLVTLQRVRGPLSSGGERQVPEFAVSLGLLLGLVAVLAIVAAIHHTSRQMDVSVILGRIVDEALAVEPIADVGTSWATGEDLPDLPDERESTVVRFDADGWVQQVDRAALLDLVPPGGVLQLETDAGRYAITGTVLCRVWPAVDEERSERLARQVRGAVHVGPTRTMSQDSGFGVRQLVDVALRALSPGVNDPTTAQDAVFHLGAVLIDRLGQPPVPTEHRDGDRRLLVPHAVTDEELAELAIAELRGAAASQPAVAIYLIEMLASVIEAAESAGAGDRVGPFRAQAALVLEHAVAADLLEDDRVRVRRAYEKRFPVEPPAP